MKPLGSLLIALSLAVGALAAATAYHAPLDADDATLLGLTLAQPAGLDPATQGPIAPAGTALDEPTLASLRAAGVRSVRTASFSLRRWPGKWWFLASVLGLAGGAWLVRAGARQAAERPADDNTPAGSPRDHLAALARGATDTLAEIQRLPDAVRTHTVIDRIDALQRDHVDPFVAARERLIARIGLGRYAGVMDAFAGGERMLNRAWSAAADNVIDESVHSLQRAAERFQESLQRFDRAAPPA